MSAQDDSPKTTTRRSVQLNTVDIAGAVIGGDFTGRAYYRLPNLRIVHVHQHFYPGEVHRPGHRHRRQEERRPGRTTSR
jgi:hypothetical protein